MTETMPTLKAIHICNSHKPTHRQKLQKSMSLPPLTDKQDEKNTEAITAVTVAQLPFLEILFPKHKISTSLEAILERFIF